MNWNAFMAVDFSKAKAIISKKKLKSQFQKYFLVHFPFWCINSNRNETNIISSGMAERSKQKRSASEPGHASDGATGGPPPPHAKRRRIGQEDGGARHGTPLEATTAPPRPAKLTLKEVVFLLNADTGDAHAQGAYKCIPLVLWPTDSHGAIVAHCDGAGLRALRGDGRRLSELMTTYVTSSPECVEIFRIWESNQRVIVLSPC